MTAADPTAGVAPTPLEVRRGPVTRRQLLRGASVALPLPFLPSLAAGAARTRNTPEKPVAPPVRFACVYFSNGVEPTHWWARPKTTASPRDPVLELGPVLEPLKEHTRDVVFLRGLFNEQARAHKSPHLGRSPNLLSGAWVSTDQSDIRCGTSMDQVMAQALDGQTELRSLALGIEPTELRLEDGLSMIYGSCISWTSPTKPAIKEIYPARVFDQLVGGGAGRAQDRSILDEVASDARVLGRRLARDDRGKLDEYLEAVRDIELRIDRAVRAKQPTAPGTWRPTLAQPDRPRPKDGLPASIPEHMRLMLDLIVLAFRMDKTRVVTFMLNNDLSQMNFGFLEGVRGALHLDLTHNGHAPEREAMYLKTNQFHFAQFAYLIEQLARIDEGESSLLRNSLLLFCSNFLDGDKHQADEMPMVLAGQAGGALQTGRVLDYLGKGDAQRRACSLHLGLLDRMGVHLPRFGDTDKRLAGL